MLFRLNHYSSRTQGFHRGGKGVRSPGPTASDRFAAMQGYWIYETSDIRYTSEKTIDNLLIEEVNFAVGFLEVQYR
jgi:hypothetical protein